MDGSMIRHAFLRGQRAGWGLRSSSLRRCVRRSAPAVHRVTSRRRAVDLCCAKYSQDQPDACDPEHRDPGPGPGPGPGLGSASPGCGPQTAPS